MNKTTWTIIFVVIVIGVGILLYVAYNKKNNKCSENDTPYQCVQKMGAVAFRSVSGQEGSAYGDYQFYSNNRVFKVSTKEKGSYDKEIITWDNGQTEKLNKIFKK